MQVKRRDVAGIAELVGGKGVNGVWSSEKGGFRGLESRSRQRRDVVGAEQLLSLSRTLVRKRRHTVLRNDSRRGEQAILGETNLFDQRWRDMTCSANQGDCHKQEDENSHSQRDESEPG